MILIKLTALGTDGSRVMLWFDDGSKMRVPTSLVADMTKVTETVTAALRGEQLQPLLLGPADQ